MKIKNLVASLAGTAALGLLLPGPALAQDESSAEVALEEIDRLFEADVDAYLQHLRTVERNNRAGIVFVRVRHTAADTSAWVCNQPVHAPINWRAYGHSIQSQLGFGQYDLGLRDARRCGSTLRLSLLFCFQLFRAQFELCLQRVPSMSQGGAFALESVDANP